MNKTLTTLAGLALWTTSAHADAPKPGLTLPEGRVNLALNIEIEATADVFGKPSSVSPDISYGVTNDLTLTLAHSTFMLTGFRGAAGKGLCATGTADGCAHAYNNVGLEGLYTLTGGAVQIALDAGVHLTDIAADFYVAKLGAKLRHVHGALSITALPSVLVAVTRRDGMPTNKDWLYVPVVANYKLTPMLGIAFGTGIKGALDDFGKAWQFPLGVIGTVTLSPQLNVGASLVFGKVLGGAEDPPDPAPDATGVRYRAIQAWVSYTL